MAFWNNILGFFRRLKRINLSLVCVFNVSMWTPQNRTFKERKKVGRQKKWVGKTIEKKSK